MRGGSIPQSASRVDQCQVRECSDRLRPAPLRPLPPGTSAAVAYVCSLHFPFSEPPPLLLPHVRAVLFVLVEHLKDVGVGQKRMWYPDRERPGVKLRIVKGHFEIQVTEIAALEPLHDMQLVAVRMPG